jgi:hypothetical protein
MDSNFYLAGAILPRISVEACDGVKIECLNDVL